MLHHSRPYTDAVDAERRPAALRRRPPPHADELDHAVRAAAAGLHSGWSTLVERLTPRVRGIARAHRLAAHDIDDIEQTTWLRLLEHIDTVREPRAVGAWVETTARRESLRILRSSRRESPTDTDHVLDRPVPPIAERRLIAAHDHAARSHAITTVAAAITTLPQRQRLLLSLLFTDPRPSYQHIAETTGIPIGSIGPTRARALARLHRAAHDHGPVARECPRICVGTNEGSVHVYEGHVAEEQDHRAGARSGA